LRRLHLENHLISRIGWLRAAVLGANDGIISTASLMLGVASASASTGEVLVAGIAGLAAGAMSMAAGEFVSVSSQADTEAADLARERKELADDPGSELAELAAIYAARGVAPALALAVAEQLTARDALGAHARDELGISAAIRRRMHRRRGSRRCTSSVDRDIVLDRRCARRCPGRHAGNVALVPGGGSPREPDLAAVCMNRDRLRIEEPRTMQGGADVVA
jgi:VIT1/CCC1 family predicted Fe2+/Mn2+ transporter